ncbi:hypothetical protein [Streptomyces sp. NPDC086010]|uniref:hypothetical protein n=1 Tax=Streptomyces sp. NPDC086010 TaxID=3365745 RepID=UPI0037CE2142
MAKNSPPAGISADYAQRIADDLSENRSAQERVRAELTNLQEQLVQLESGEQVLIKMQAVLDTTAEPVAPAVESRTTASVPSARRAKGRPAARKRAGKSAPEPARTKPAASAPEPAKTKSTAAKGAAPKTTAVKGGGSKSTAVKGGGSKSAGEPTWRELVGKYLSGQREPKSSAEVAAALTQEQPKRGVQVAVVRNTLEQGVAQGLLERHKQGRSVFYGLVSPRTSADSAPEAAETHAR